MNQTQTLKPGSFEVDMHRLSRRLRTIQKAMPDKEYVVKISDQKEKRKDAQNRLSHHWYGEISVQKYESISDSRAFCKLHFGVPIACEKWPDFLAFWEKIKASYSYQEQLKIMLPPVELAITRDFNTKEMVGYLTAIETHMSNDGIRLSTSDDLYFESMMRQAA